MVSAYLSLKILFRFGLHLYRAVYRAMCDECPCVAKIFKILHLTSCYWNWDSSVQPSETPQ